MNLFPFVVWLVVGSIIGRFIDDILISICCTHGKSKYNKSNSA